MAKLTGLYRFDSPSNSSFGWQVTIQRKGTRFNKFFSDGRHGGRQEAFKAAKFYRQSVLSSYDAYSRKELCLKLKRSNQTGYPGVCRAQSRVSARSPRLRWYWIATWTPVEGEPAKSKKFSIRRYGEQRAFRLALQFRREKLLEMFPH